MARKGAKTWETEKAPFPCRLSEIMKEQNVSQEKLANALGVKRQTVSLYKTGQSSPNAEQLYKIANFFDISADWLLGLSETKSPDSDIQHICRYTGLTQGAVEELHKLVAHNDGINAVLTFINTFLSSDVLRHFKKAAFYEAALRISYNKSGQGTPMSDLNDDIADRLHLIELEQSKRDAQIMSDLTSTEQTTGIIEVSTQEASILYERIAHTALGAIYDDAIFEIENKYRIEANSKQQNRPQCSSTRDGKDAT